jgi:hypothetical protein
MLQHWQTKAIESRGIDVLLAAVTWVLRISAKEHAMVCTTLQATADKYHATNQFG